MINKNRLIKLTQKLIQIDSQNPGSDEFPIVSFIKDYLSGLGLKIRIHEFQKRRSNLLVTLKGDKNESLLISPHLDTVPAGARWSVPAFSGRIYKDRIYGLGATDCKGNLAAAIEVINSLAEDRVALGYNLILAATADEESGSGLGLIPLLDKGVLKPDAALILDADEFNIIITQKGLLHVKVKIQGRRAHGAYPWLGVNAIDIALKILKDLKSRKAGSRRDKYLRPATMNIGTIRGGDKVNIVADWCEFELDFRFLPGDSAEKILKYLNKAAGRHSPRFKIEVEGIQKPYCIESNHPLVNYLALAMRQFKVKPQIRGSEGATVITFFKDKNIPAVATGFGQEGCAHSADEYIKIGSLCKGALVLERFLKLYHF
ncbi:MAG: M20 family metallopeptidase [Candidatus Omnitrophica bacterium]|nr:M20 family metallopeptidase [Candidatus Omnitrophota bacterium]